MMEKTSWKWSWNNIGEIKIVPDSIVKSCARFEFSRTIQTPSEIGTRRIWVDSRSNTIVNDHESSGCGPVNHRFIYAGHKIFVILNKMVKNR